MRVNLGGDRVGSGNKMEVDLSTFNRSTFNLSNIVRTSMSVGTLVPFGSYVGLPGDTWDIKINGNVLTKPTVGPLFGSHKFQCDVYTCDWRLYNSHLHNNTLGIGLRMQDIKLPVVEYNIKTSSGDASTWDNSQVNPSCLNAYLGLRGYGINMQAPTVQRTFNAIPILGYWDIYKNYYANKQEEIGAVVHTPLNNLIDTVEGLFLEDSVELPENLPTAGDIPLGIQIAVNYTGTMPDLSQILVNTNRGLLSLRDLQAPYWFPPVGSPITVPIDTARWGFDLLANYWRYISNSDLNNIPPVVTTFDLSNIDDMRAYLLSQTAYLPVQLNDSGDGTGLTPYKWLWTGSNTQNYSMTSQEGLAIKTYQSDILQAWLNTDWIDGDNGVNTVTAIDTSSGEFKIDTLNIMTKVYNMLNRVAVSGGSYDDYIGAVWQPNNFTRPESPVYRGGLSKEIVFQQVVSNAAATDDSGTQPLGTLAGRGVMGDKHKGGNITIKVNEPTQIIMICSITPRIDYSQGNNWDVNLISLNDLHKPNLDGIGFEESINEYRAWWTTQWTPGDSKFNQTSAGKVPAWSNYQTNINKTYGNFAIPDSEMFMTNNRRYEAQLDITVAKIKDLTTYIDPSKFNNIFAQTALDAQNYWVQIAVDMQVRRLMSARKMPIL